MVDAAPAPAAKPPGSVNIKKGGINLQVNVEMNMSKELVMKPFSLAPDVQYGVTPELTVALITSNAGTTGFRGASGAGLCLAGEEKGCKTVFNNVGLQGTYGFMKGSMALGGQAGIFTTLTKDAMGDGLTLMRAKVGLVGKYTAGKIMVNFATTAFIGVSKRKDANNTESLWVPVAVGYKATPELTVGLGTGVKIPHLSKAEGAAAGGAGDEWNIPVGVSGNYAINKQMSAGLAFVLGNVAGGKVAHPDGLGAADNRHLHVWFGYSM
jgi:hypothetical protein